MKTLELENYGIVEMNQQEMMEIERGFPWLLVGALMFLAHAAY